MIGTVGARVSFQEGSELLTERAEVAVDAKQVERTDEARGKEIAGDAPQTPPTPNLSILFPRRGTAGAHRQALGHLFGRSRKVLLP